MPFRENRAREVRGQSRRGVNNTKRETPKTRQTSGKTAPVKHERPKARQNSGYFALFEMPQKALITAVFRVAGIEDAETP